MIISRPVDPFAPELRVLRHTRVTPMGLIYRLLWTPRAGRGRRLAERLRPFFLRWRARPGTRNVFHLAVRRRSGERRVLVETKDLQLGPWPRSLEYGHEPDLQFLLRTLAPSIELFCDIGANYGFFSLCLSAEPTFRGSIVAFEPSPATYANLTCIVRAVDPENVISTRNLALSDADGQANMVFPLESHSGYARIGEGEGVTVATARLDGFELSPTMMKIDVEGHELNVLRGATETIERSRPYVYFENGRDLPEEEQRDIFGFFRSRSYAIFIPTWIYQAADLWRTCRVPVRGEQNHLALINISDHGEILSDRKVLMTLNLFACPEERIPALRAALTKPVPTPEEVRRAELAAWLGGVDLVRLADGSFRLQAPDRSPAGLDAVAKGLGTGIGAGPIETLQAILAAAERIALSGRRHPLKRFLDEHFTYHDRNMRSRFAAPLSGASGPLQPTGSEDEARQALRAILSEFVGYLYSAMRERRLIHEDGGSRQ